jgi:hypothetical protein
MFAPLVFISDGQKEHKEATINGRRLLAEDLTIPGL